MNKQHPPKISAGAVKGKAVNVRKVAVSPSPKTATLKSKSGTGNK